jgi:hypothetical protein
LLDDLRERFAYTYAWFQMGESSMPRPDAAAERLHQLWITPHGVLKAAMAHNTTVQTRLEGNLQRSTMAFVGPDKRKFNVHINERNLVDKVESWVTHPVLGDMLTETTYAEYQNYDGVQFPTRIMQQQGGFPTTHAQHAL